MIKRVLSCVLCALSLPWVLTAEGFNSWQEFDAWVISNYVAMADGRGCIPPARPVFYHAMGAFPFAEAIIYANGDARLPLTITLGVKNVADDLYPSTVMVYAYPLRVVQHNMPHAGGIDGSTDLGDDYKAKVISRNGVAYITGAPQPPQLTAEFKGAPEWLPIQWRGTLETERFDYRFEGIDNRTFIPLTNNLYNITAALTNEVIGGACDLQFSVLGLTNELACGSFPFYIRGKNPKDETAKAYIEAHVDSEFQDIAWMIAKHESKSGSRCYNQFNPGVGQYSALPNWGDPYGWGMSQIDKGSNGVHAVILYDWHKNVEEMNETLREKRDDYNRFIGYYRAAYKDDPTTRWFEPNDVTTNVNGNVITARQWGLLTLYNGATDCGWVMVNGHRFQSPVHFDPVTTNWVFRANSNNYVPKVFESKKVKPTE